MEIIENFSNGRSARNILQAAIREKACRIGDSQGLREELVTLNPEDFCVNLEFNPCDKVKDLQKELDNLVGLKEVKYIIKCITNTLELQHRKKEMGIEYEDISLNMIFVGNPCTGKTTVARIIGRILKCIGILKKGHMDDIRKKEEILKITLEDIKNTLT